MNRLAPYVNEIVSFVVMLLLIVALVAGQSNAREIALAAAENNSAEAPHIRLEDE